MTSDTTQAVQLLIVADDLTGAADCAVATGAEAVVGLNGPSLADAVVALDINSRECGAAEAARRVRSTLAALPARDAAVYQKMDSTMRGNWAAELAAIRMALAAQRGTAQLAVVCPAYPELGRSVHDGIVRTDGAAAEARGSLRAALGDAGIDAQFVPVLPSDTLRSAVQHARTTGAEAIICDAQTRADLDRVAAATVALKAAVFWCGSAGLMGSLAPHLTHSRRRSPRALPKNGRILVVVGSAADASHRQLDLLGRCDGAATVAWTADQLTGGAAEEAALRRDLVAATIGSRCVAVSIAKPAAGMAIAGADLVAGLARTIVPLLSGFDGLVLTGGETARAMLVGAGATAMRITGEVEPGVPIGHTMGALERPVVTKAGAFGTPLTLVRAVAALTARPNLPESC